MPRTQVLDTAHGLSGVIEKGLDLQSYGAIGQSDVRQYFDSIDLLRVFEFLVSNGLPLSVAAACLRHQLLPKVLISVGCGVAHIGGRSSGSLTGSRLAGAAAQVPIRHTCVAREKIWRQYGFALPDGTLTLYTYVDNCFAAARSCHAVTEMLDDVEQFLSTEWGLSIKPSSRLVMVPHRSPDASVKDPEKYPIVENMKVLGHILQSDGGVNLCFDNTVNQMWRAFYANCAGRSAQRLSCKLRLTLLARAVLPILRCRWTRWPFTVSRALALDGIQRRMASIILDVRMLPCESPDDFGHRRAGFISSVLRNCGRWSKMWAAALVGWAEHLGRARNAQTWAAKLAHLRPPDELAHRRAHFGRPGTRVGSGWIKRRWWESLTAAKTHVGQQ